MKNSQVGPLTKTATYFTKAEYLKLFKDTLEKNKKVYNAVHDVFPSLNPSQKEELAYYYSAVGEKKRRILDHFREYLERNNQISMQELGKLYMDSIQDSTEMLNKRPITEMATYLGPAHESLINTKYIKLPKEDIIYKYTGVTRNG